MVDTIPVMTTGRDADNDPVEISAEAVTGEALYALLVKLMAENGDGDLVPFKVGAGGVVETTPSPTVIIQDVADISLTTGNSVLIGPHDVLAYKRIAGHLVGNQVLTYTLKYGRLSTLASNKTTLEAVTTTAANEPVEFRESVFLGQYFGILISNASGSTATISGQILGFPA